MFQSSIPSFAVLDACASVAKTCGVAVPFFQEMFRVMLKYDLDFYEVVHKVPSSLCGCVALYAK